MKRLQRFSHREICDQQVNRCIIKDIGYFVWFEEIVDWDDHAASHQNPEERRHKFRTIPEPESDSDPGDHPVVSLEMPGECGRMTKNLSISDLLISIENRGLGRSFASRRGEGVRQVHTSSLNPVRSGEKSNWMG